MLETITRSKCFHKLSRKVGQAIEDFAMIKNNDHVLVCLSGGKDSWTLLTALLYMQQKAPLKFKITAINIDPLFPGYESQSIQTTATKLGVDCKIVQNDFAKIINENSNRENSFCPFCARLRRGMIYTAAQEIGANKIALGHHRDDFNETLLMNLFFSGQLKAMSANYLTDNGAHHVIRPLVYVAEKDIIEFAQEARFPIVDCACTIGKSEDHQRKRMKTLLAELEKTTPDVQSNMLNALGNIQRDHFLDTRTNTTAVDSARE